MKHFFIKKQLNKEKKPFLYVKIAIGRGEGNSGYRPDRQTELSKTSTDSVKHQDTGDRIQSQGKRFSCSF